MAPTGGIDRGSVERNAGGFVKSCGLFQAQPKRQKIETVPRQGVSNSACQESIGNRCQCSLRIEFRCPAQAQQAASPAGTRIAVVDVGFIVKNHPTIRQQQTAIKDQVKVTQEELVKRREALVKEAEKLKEFKEGSPQFNQIQEQLANQEAQLKLDMVRKEKEIDTVEAQMAITFYKRCN